MVKNQRIFSHTNARDNTYMTYKQDTHTHSLTNAHIPIHTITTTSYAHMTMRCKASY